MSRDKTYAVTMLDSTQLRVALPKKSNGQDCLDQVRKLLTTPQRNPLLFNSLIAGLSLYWCPGKGILRVAVYWQVWRTVVAERQKPNQRTAW